MNKWPKQVIQYISKNISECISPESFGRWCKEFKEEHEQCNSHSFTLQTQVVRELKKVEKIRYLTMNQKVQIMFVLSRSIGEEFQEILKEGGWQVKLDEKLRLEYVCSPDGKFQRSGWHTGGKLFRGKQNKTKKKNRTGQQNTAGMAPPEHQNPIEYDIKVEEPWFPINRNDGGIIKQEPIDKYNNEINNEQQPELQVEEDEAEMGNELHREEQQEDEHVTQLEHQGDDENVDFHHQPIDQPVLRGRPGTNGYDYWMEPNGRREEEAEKKVDPNMSSDAVSKPMEHLNAHFLPSEEHIPMPNTNFPDFDFEQLYGSGEAARDSVQGIHQAPAPDHRNYYMPTETNANPSDETAGGDAEITGTVTNDSRSSEIKHTSSSRTISVPSLNDSLESSPKASDGRPSISNTLPKSFSTLKRGHEEMITALKRSKPSDKEGENESVQTVNTSPTSAPLPSAEDLQSSELRNTSLNSPIGDTVISAKVLAPSLNGITVLTPTESSKQTGISNMVSKRVSDSNPAHDEMPAEAKRSKLSDEGENMSSETATTLPTCTPLPSTDDPQPSLNSSLASPPIAFKKQTSISNMAPKHVATSKRACDEMLTAAKCLKSSEEKGESESSETTQTLSSSVPLPTSADSRIVEHGATPLTSPEEHTGSTQTTQSPSRIESHSRASTEERSLASKDVEREGNQTSQNTSRTRQNSVALDSERLSTPSINKIPSATPNSGSEPEEALASVDATSAATTYSSQETGILSTIAPVKDSSSSSTTMPPLLEPQTFNVVRFANQFESFAEIFGFTGLEKKASEVRKNVQNKNKTTSIRAFSCLVRGIVSLIEDEKVQQYEENSIKTKVFYKRLQNFLIRPMGEDMMESLVKHIDQKIEEHNDKTFIFLNNICNYLEMILDGTVKN